MARKPFFPHRRQKIVLCCLACGRRFTSESALERHFAASARPLWDRAFWLRPASRSQVQEKTKRAEPRAGRPGFRGAQRPSESPPRGAVRAADERGQRA